MLLPCRRMYAVRKKRALFEDSYAARWGCILYHTKWRVLLDHEKDSRKTSTMATTSTSEATTPQTQDDKVRHVLQSCKHLAELAFEKNERAVPETCSKRCPLNTNLETRSRRSCPCSRGCCLRRPATSITPQTDAGNKLHDAAKGRAEGLQKEPHDMAAIPSNEHSSLLNQDIAPQTDASNKLYGATEYSVFFYSCGAWLSTQMAEPPKEVPSGSEEIH